MRAKLLLIVLIASVLASLIGCASLNRDAARASVTIESVRVASDEIVCTGESTLPDGTCLQTQLFSGADAMT
jgi:hypothetical protein